MMKILFLNPHVDTGHQIVRALQARDIGVLLPLDTEEAWQMLQLHGTSVSLAVIHKEGMKGGDEGIRFLKKLKASPDQADLPVILTSGEWGDSEFAEHQNSPEGANAYLPWPHSGEQLLNLVDQIFSSEAVSAASTSIVGEVSFDSSLLQRPEPPAEPSTQALSLDDGGSVLTLGSIQEPIPQEAPQPPSLPAENEFGLQPLGDASDLDAPIAMPEGDSPNGTMALSLGEQELEPPTQDLPLSQGLPLPQPEPESEQPIETQAQPEAQSEEEDDGELAADLPYLFSSKAKKPEDELLTQSGPEMIFAEPVGDAVVPGGAAQTPDTETLKKYLILREQDVAVLSSKLRTADERIATLESALRAERGKVADLDRILEDRRVRIDGFEKEKALAVESLQVEIAEMRFQNKAKSDKARLLEQQVKEATDEIERLKDRVRSDIRKIRIREKELENKLELMKKDSEALLAGRENKIIELKRKVDLLEFNMDLLQDQYSREKETSGRLREKLSKAAQVVRVAAGILNTGDTSGASSTTGTDAASSGPVKPEGEPKAS